MEDVLCLDGVEQAKLVRTRQIRADELVAAAIRRIERLDPEINALTQRYFDEALMTARQGLPAGPFRGVPFLVKDFYCHMQGKPTLGGSRLLANAVVDHDSELMARYRRAGFVTLGKTAVPEMVTIGTTEPSFTGPTRNPWNLAHTPGGSSGGSAAAVAAGMVAIAHANDGAGSTRIPASFCGLYGLKPSRGRITLGPDVGESIGGITAEHVVTRSVRDSAAVLDATAGGMPGDPYVTGEDNGRFLEATRHPPRRLRIAFSHEALFRTELDPDCRAAVDGIAKHLEAEGHIVELAKPRVDAEAFREALSAFWPMTVTRALFALAKARSVDVDGLAAELEPLNQHLFGLGRARLAVDYVQDLVTFQNVTRSFGAFFESYDLWLTPTVTFPPPKLGFFDPRNSSTHEAYRRVIDSFAFTAPANVCGLPAASLPTHWTDGGLPVGVQLTGPLGSESLILSTSAEIESGLDWASLRPKR